MFGEYSVNNNQAGSTGGGAEPDSGAVPGNLPPESASFVGREPELGLLDRLLSERRLITLTGVGGVGKSRLALRAAAVAGRARPDGVWWVELSPLRDPALLTTTVAHVVGLADHSARSLDEELCAWVADKELLLVLDTCEHLVAACRHLVGELLQSAPGLTVLITSREPLGSPCEEVVEVRPLPCAGPDSDALTLFRARALSATPRAAVAFEDAGRTAIAAELCRRLDGIPLALELAGARMRLWTLEQMAERIGERFDVLADTRAATLPSRHRTMRTAIGWSHELCEPLERLLWARLSVFTGDFDVAAARAVCAGGPMAASRVERVLAGLVAKSVVRRTEERGAGARYRMLDTIREYGHDWLGELGEVRIIADRHAHWYAALSQAAGQGWLGPGQVDWYRRMTTEHAQLRTALEHLLGSDPTAALEMAGSLWFYWFACGHVHEGRAFLERALDSAPPTGAAYNQALWALGLTTLLQGDLETARRIGEQCTEGAAHLADPERELRAAYLQAVSVLMPGDPVRALELAGPRARAGHGGRTSAPGWLLCKLATGYALCDLGRFEEATAEARSLRETCAELGERWLRAYADYVLALAALGLGDHGEAARHVRAMLSGKRLLGDRFGIALGLDLLAAAVAGLGDGELAARLLGTGHAWWRTVGRPQMGGSPSLTALRDQGERQARAAIGDAAYETAFRGGAAASTG
ncbi:NB-ARC domain-containing protein [Streptomyces sp. NBC_00047]|uniref:ATP-binding protein n=1 Tax=Streptomyces sp. NBC_00047 TaxID=2975627 RepID=UPI0022525D8E|nr:NB-ARC domain-containing protein [Streptomyces sp. NBC_00047]MCX5609252.1 NB-ARC domain-containing protein [Streptomyces sp. NBC_00047]